MRTVFNIFPFLSICTSSLLRNEMQMDGQGEKSKRKRGAEKDMLPHEISSILLMLNSPQFDVVLSGEIVSDRAVLLASSASECSLLAVSRRSVDASNRERLRLFLRILAIGQCHGQVCKFSNWKFPTRRDKKKRGVL